MFVDRKLKTADRPLPRTLTQEFLTDLRQVLTADTSFAASYLDSVITSKYLSPDKGSAELRRARAIEKWLAVERENSLTNRRIISALQSTVEVLPGVSAKRFLGKARSFISTILPPQPSLDVSNGTFSGGASTSKARTHSFPAMKFQDKADVTRLSLPFFYDVIRGSMWDRHLHDAFTRLEPRIVKGNVMFTVPKTSEIDRVACKEPDLNMFLQRGFGNQIRSLLKRVGTDLNDQSRNRKLAQLGSITGSLATIDLSSASDSVTTELVRVLLPDDWFYYLDLTRSHVTIIDGVEHQNQMFSSMGNGFTFELESLIFLTLARTTAYFGGFKGSISVYGDDIIIPTDMFDNLVSVLAFCGFKTNDRKSCRDGNFRESCGGHYLCGEDVKPFYIRRPFATTSDLILALNQLTEWASRGTGVVDPRYAEVIYKFSGFVDSRLYGGSDLTSRTSLVTGHNPRYELIAITKRKAVPQVGSYLFWSHLKLSSMSSDVVVSWSVPTGLFRLRSRRRSWLGGEIEHDVPIFLDRSRFDVTSLDAAYAVSSP